MSDGQRTLILLRHAKSAYPDGVADHDRPLAPRGVREAGLAGDWLRADLPPIDTVLCSTARRTRQTLQLTGVDAPVTYLDRLYDTTPGTVIDELNRLGGPTGASPTTVLVVGHEPTMSGLALILTGAPGSDPTVAARVAEKYPTSAIAVLRVPCDWPELEPGRAALIDLHVPR